MASAKGNVARFGQSGRVSGLQKLQKTRLTYLQDSSYSERPYSLGSNDLQKPLDRLGVVIKGHPS